MEETIIRHYKKDDREVVRDIAWQTAFLGSCADAFFTDKEVFTDFLTLCFTDHEPESCFVATAKGEVIGYLIGAKDIAALLKKVQWGIGSRLFLRLGLRGVFFRKKNLVFIFNSLRSLLRGEFKEPDLSKEYPATLHINIKEGYRASGTGSKLMEAYLGYLKGCGVKGVHLATFSEKAGVFFAKHGFNRVYDVRRSYFRHILGRDVTVYGYARKL